METTTKAEIARRLSETFTAEYGAPVEFELMDWTVEEDRTMLTFHGYPEDAAWGFYAIVPDAEGSDEDVYMLSHSLDGDTDGKPYDSIGRVVAVAKDLETA